MANAIAGSLIFDTKTDTDGFNKGTADIDKKTKNMEGSFKKLGVAIAAAFSISVIKDFGQILLETTAKLQAMDAQFDQIFQGAENQQALDEINKKSEELGIHADILKQSFSQFGAQLKGAGMEAQKAMEATSTATSLAADAAAFYDMSMANASASLASFLKGNFEAGDAIGVFTNATQMSVQANEVYGKSWDKLTEAEKQWLLLDKVGQVYELNGASGQAAREQDSWAISTENLAATWDRFLQIVGSPVLQGIIPIVQGITEALGSLVKFMKENPAVVQTFMDIIISFLGALAAYLIAKNITGMITGLSKAFDLFSAALVSPAGRVALLAGALLLLVQMIIRLSDAWGKMTGAEKLTTALWGIIAVATAAAIAVGAFQSALTMGIAAAAIVAGILAIESSMKSAEARAKASTPSGGGSSFRIPQLATGAVIPPNSEFLAILGDQKSGTNIEAPLSTIEQALRNVLTERGGTNGNSPVVLQIDGKELARTMASYNTGETNRLGTRLINGVT